MGFAMQALPSRQLGSEAWPGYNRGNRTRNRRERIDFQEGYQRRRARPRLPDLRGRSGTPVGWGVLWRAVEIVKVAVPWFI